jgi:hypothetical protein
VLASVSCPFLWLEGDACKGASPLGNGRCMPVSQVLVAGVCQVAAVSTASEEAAMHVATVSQSAESGQIHGVAFGINAMQKKPKNPTKTSQDARSFTQIFRIGAHDRVNKFSEFYQNLMDSVPTEF